MIVFNKLILGPWYTGNTLPWHGRVRGPIPLGSTIYGRIAQLVRARR